MNEEALQYSYELFKKDGYSGSIDDYKQLISTNEDAVNYSYELFNKDGYTGKREDFNTLIGVTSGGGEQPLGKSVDGSEESEEPSEQPLSSTPKVEGLYVIQGKGYSKKEVEAVAKENDLSLDKYLSRVGGTYMPPQKAAEVKAESKYPNVLEGLYQATSSVSVNDEDVREDIVSNLMSDFDYEYEDFLGEYRRVEPTQKQLEDYFGEEILPTYLKLRRGEEVTEKELRNVFGNQKVDGVINQHKRRRSEAYISSLDEEERLYGSKLMNPGWSEDMNQRKADEEDYFRQTGRELVREVEIGGRVYKPTFETLFKNGLVDTVPNEDVKEFTKSEVEAIDAKSQILEKDFEALESKVNAFNENYGPAIQRMNELAEEMSQFHVVVGSPEKKEALIKEYMQLRSQLDTPEAKKIESEIAESNKIIQEETKNLSERAAYVSDLNIASDAINREYRAGARALKVMEQSFLGSGAMLGSAFLKASGMVLSGMASSEDKDLLANQYKDWAEGLYRDAVDYNKVLSNQMDRDYILSYDVSDVISGDVGVRNFLFQSLADNSPSLATIAIGGGVGSGIARGVTSAITKKAISNATKNIIAATFFTQEAGGKMAELEVRKENLAQRKEFLMEELPKAKTEFEKTQIQKEISSIDGMLSDGFIKNALISVLYGGIAAGAERIGTLRYLDDLNGFAKINRGAIRNVGNEGARAFGKTVALSGRVGKGVLIENIEETATLVGQNLVDMLLTDDNKSLIDGLDANFFTQVSLTSLALQGPSAGMNIQGILGTYAQDQFSKGRIRKLSNELINLQVEYNNKENLTYKDKQRIRERKAEIMVEMGLNHLIDKNRLIYLLEKDVENGTNNVQRLADLNRRNNAILKEAKALDKTSTTAASDLKVLKDKKAALESEMEVFLSKETQERLQEYRKMAEEAGVDFNELDVAFSDDLFNTSMSIVDYQVELNNSDKKRPKINLFKLNLEGRLGKKREDMEVDEVVEYLEAESKRRGVEIDSGTILGIAGLYLDGGNGAFSSGSNSIFTFEDNVKKVIAAVDGEGERRANQISDISVRVAAVSPVHELLHAFNKQNRLTDVDINENIESAIASLEALVLQKYEDGDISEKEFKYFEVRKQKYDRTKNKNEELVNLVSDLTFANVLKRNDYNTMYEFKVAMNNINRKLLSIIPGLNAGESSSLPIYLKNGEDVFNYISSFQRKIINEKQVIMSMPPSEEDMLLESGRELTEEEKAALDEAVKEKNVSKIKKIAKDNVSELASALYAVRGVDAAFEIADLWRPLIQKRLINSNQFSGYRNNDAWNDDLADDIAFEVAMGDGSQTVRRSVERFDPEKGVPLGAHINKFLNAHINYQIKKKFPNLMQQSVELTDARQFEAVEVVDDYNEVSFDEMDLSIASRRIKTEEKQRKEKRGESTKPKKRRRRKRKGVEKVAKSPELVQTEQTVDLGKENEKRELINPVELLSEGGKGIRNLRKEVVDAIKEESKDELIEDLTFAKIEPMGLEPMAAALGIKKEKLTNPKSKLTKAEIRNAQVALHKMGLENLIKLLPYGTVPSPVGDVMKKTLETSDQPVADFLVGTTTGLFENIKKEFYEKGPRVKTKEGIEEQIKRKDISVDEMAAYLGIDRDGNSIKTRRDDATDTRAKGAVGQNVLGMANLVAKLTTNKVLRDQLEAEDAAIMTIANLAAGKSDFMASISDDDMARISVGLPQFMIDYRAKVEEGLADPVTSAMNSAYGLGKKSGRVIPDFSNKKLGGILGRSIDALTLVIQNDKEALDFINSNMMGLLSEEGGIAYAAQQAKTNLVRITKKEIVNGKEVERKIVTETGKKVQSYIKDGFASFVNASRKKDRGESVKEAILAYYPVYSAMYSDKAKFFNEVVRPYIKENKIKGFSVVKRGNKAAFITYNGETVKPELNVKAVSPEQISGKGFAKYRSQSERYSAFFDRQLRLLDKAFGEEDIDVYAGFLYASSTNMESPMKMAGTVNYVMFSEDNPSLKLTYEHVVPTSFMARALILNKMGNLSDEMLAKIREKYTIAFVPKEFDTQLNSTPGLKSSMNQGWTIESSEIERYEAVPSIRSYKIMEYNPTSVDNEVKLERLNLKHMKYVLLDETIADRQYKKMLTSTEQKAYVDLVEKAKRVKKRKPRKLVVLEMDLDLAMRGNIKQVVKKNGKVTRKNVSLAQYATEKSDPKTRASFEVENFKNIPVLNDLVNAYSIEGVSASDIKLLFPSSKYDEKIIKKLLSDAGVVSKERPFFKDTITKLRTSSNNELVDVLAKNLIDSKYNEVVLRSSIPKSKKSSAFIDGFLEAVKADKTVEAVKKNYKGRGLIDVGGDVKASVSDADSKMKSILVEKFGGIASGDISEARASNLGQRVKRTSFWIPPSADDFMGLLYHTLPKGKKGDEALKFYKETLMDPFARAEQGVDKLTISMNNDYKQLKKDLGITPKLMEADAVLNFSNEQALRAWMFFQGGHKIPGLSESDLKAIKAYIKENPELKAIGEGIMKVSRSSTYVKPKESWLAGSIAEDMYSIVRDVHRKNLMFDFINNSELVFNDENMRALKASLGKKYVDILNETLDRMKTGVNRRPGDKHLGKALDYINGSVGAIMFLNMRSAALQTISAINFINWSFNNPVNAGVAFANQKQFWSDFMMLFNSDYLVSRRNGLKINVSESEIAEIINKGDNRDRIKLVMSKIIKAGYKPTQFADSFAIAIGGASYFRNATKMLMKEEGLSREEAEERAMLMFRETSEENQQSSRADKISSLQASGLGRLVFAFANTPMQYARITKKATLDLVNGRGDWKTNISKIIYYTFLQNVIFSTLQSGLFAAFFSAEEEDEDEMKNLDMVNSMLNGILRGTGLPGAIIATMKDVVFKLYKESKKPRPKYGMATLELFNLIPPVDSKVSKVKNAFRAAEYGAYSEESLKKGFSGPSVEPTLQVISAITNAPLDRVYTKLNNTATAVGSDDIEMWQRVALLFGWPGWQLGITGDEGKNTGRVGAVYGSDGLEVNELDMLMRSKQQSRNK